MYLKTQRLKTIDNQNNKTMKKAFTLIAIAALAFGTVNFSKAADGKTSNNNNAEVITTLTEVHNVSKIEVRGNVEVFVTSGNDEKVKVYNRYYAEDAFVQNQDGTLKIAAYGSEKLVVWVTVSDLRDINVYDNAEVRSFGKLSAIDLNVNLHDNATANLDVDSFNASFNIDGKAKANLAGTVNDCQLNYAAAATVNQSQLKAAHMTQNRTVVHTAANDALATL
jgi:hypothetical protein